MQNQFFYDKNNRKLYIRNWSLLLQERFGKVGLIHIDAHTDTSENQAGSRFVHGSLFR